MLHNKENGSRVKQTALLLAGQEKRRKGPESLFLSSFCGGRRGVETQRAFEYSGGSRGGGGEWSRKCCMDRSGSIHLRPQTGFQKNK